jgi:hypothetical protein
VLEFGLCIDFPHLYRLSCADWTVDLLTQQLALHCTTGAGRPEVSQQAVS